VRSDFALGKFADTLAQVILFIGKREIHASLASKEMEYTPKV
jgi:hypothetical protein